MHITTFATLGLMLFTLTILWYSHFLFKRKAVVLIIIHFKGSVRDGSYCIIMLCYVKYIYVVSHRLLKFV